ncbi:TSUP family transporter [Afifella sp. YEN Y35]|uniref:TSUP family transporter n=1 Tax=Afifella sp. YEN Y35 TaxID=3388337 RepID=UPI0039E1C973
MEKFLTVAGDPATLSLTLVVLVAGTVRGFAGFGAGLVFVPFAGSLIGPRAAVIILWAIDSLPTLPILIPALRVCNYRSVLPAAGGVALCAPFGAYLLATADPLVLRWGMSAVVLALVVLLGSGLRFTGPRRPASAFGVGMLSGVLGGATQLSGPPVVVYWMSGHEAAAEIRANLIVFFALSTVITGLSFWANGIFSEDALIRAAVAAPVYFVALILGQKMFGFASEKVFRRVALGLIVAAAIMASPAFDGVLR